MRRTLLFAFALLVAIPALAAATAAWVLYTAEGLAWAARQATRLTNGTLVLEYETGTLRDGAHFTAIRYETPPLGIRAENVRLRVSPASLLRLAPRVSELRAEVLRLRTQQKTDEPPQPLEVPALPFALHIEDACIARLLIERDGATTEIDNVFVRYDGGPEEHRVHEARLRVLGIEVSAAGAVGSDAPYPVDAQATLMRETPAPRASVRIRADGSLQRIALELEADSAGAHVSAQGELHPAAPQPLARLSASLSGLDLHAFDAALPQTALSGELALAREDALLSGKARVSNEMSGPYDAGRLPVASVRSAIRTDMSTVDLTELLVDLTAGRLAGSAQVTQARIALRLTAREVNLAALHGRLRETSLSGKAEGVVTRDRQSATADLTQDDMRLQFRAERDGTTMVLHEATLHARGGEARARGKLALTAKQPFLAHAALRGFDPAAWGDFPPGAINGQLEARGTVEGPTADVEFKLSDSRLNHAPLSGKGRVSLKARRLADADVSLQFGDNRVKVSGAFGAPNDALRAQWNARRLDTLHPQLAGALHGEAQFTGTLDAPRVRFKARAEGLHAPVASVQRATASGTFARDPSAPLRLEAQASGVEVAGRLFERMTFEMTGTQPAHTAALSARGAGLDAKARVSGGWDEHRRTWSGTLLEFANRGALDAALETPVSMSASAERIVVGAFTLRVLDGRLDAEESRYEQGRLSTKGRYSRLPVVELAKAAGVPPRVAGELRLSGDWVFIQDAGLKGSFSAKRESGDLRLGPDGRFPMELRAFSLAARIDSARLEFNASLASTLVNADTNGTIGILAAGHGAGVRASSPLRFDAQITVAQLAPIASLLQLTAIINGTLNAKLAGSGTLGKPLVTGELRGERLAVALPQQGIDLRDGSLRAVLLERAIRFESFSLRGGGGTFTARGDMGLNGADTRLEWQAERLLLLARPDRRLIVSGKGRTGVTGGNVSFSGGIRAEEGHFEIATQGLPQPGPDVIVVGRAPPPRQESALARMRLEIVVNFGENFRVRGRGIDTLLRGETVATTPKGELHAKGTLRTARGVFTALGQRLEIERGELLFTGPLDNPGLDILAMRKRQSVEAGVAVTGTLQTPVVRIVSEPPVPEHEAISWLLLGHGSSEASRADLAMLPLAASALLGKGDSPTIAQRFGLDTLGVRGAGTDQQFLTIGKRIADKLYVGFEQGLGTAASILKLEYDLTERALLRVQTGESNAIGVFYRYSFD